MQTESATAARDHDAPARPPSAALVEEAWAPFVAWASDELGMRVAPLGPEFRIAPADEPADEDPSASGLRRSWLGRRREPDAADGDVTVVGTPRAVLDELIGRLGRLEIPAFGRPAEQPEAVHDFTDRLFAAYTLDGGKAHVAGFHLEDRPFVRLTTIVEHGSREPTLRHEFYDDRGEGVSDALVEALGLGRVVAGVKPWPRRDANRLRAAVDTARRTAGANADTVLASIVWAKHASGRLRFEFGDESVDATFDGWARTLEAPSVICPETGRETLHLAATDDGRIAAAEAIAVSSVTGERRLVGELETCAVTGGLVEPELTQRCAATDRPVRTDRVVNCPRCGQRVAPSALTADACVGCEGAERVAPTDERIAPVLEKHPRLREQRWSLAETPRSYVLLASSWTRRRCVTIDKESLEVVREAEAPRFSSAWRVVG